MKFSPFLDVSEVYVGIINKFSRLDFNIEAYK